MGVGNIYTFLTRFMTEPCFGNPVSENLV